MAKSCALCIFAVLLTVSGVASSRFSSSMVAEGIPASSRSSGLQMTLPRRILMGSTVTVESSSSLSVSGEGYSPVLQSSASKTVLDSSGSIQFDSSESTSVEGDISMLSTTGSSLVTDGSEVSAKSSQSLTADGATIPKVEQSSASGFSTATDSSVSAVSTATTEYDYAEDSSPEPEEYAPEPDSTSEPESEPEPEPESESEPEPEPEPEPAQEPADYAEGNVEAAGFQARMETMATSLIPKWLQRG